MTVTSSNGLYHSAVASVLSLRPVSEETAASACCQVWARCKDTVVDLWLAGDIMHHRWLLLIACFWVLFMLMVASKFITLTMRSPEGYGIRQGSLTIVPDLEKMTVTEARKFQVESQPTVDTLKNMTVLDFIHKERLELLRSVCRNESLRNLSHSLISKFVLDRIFVSDENRILFCQTPKVGNTQWKKVLIVLNGAFSSIEDIPENVVHDHEKNGLPRLSSYSRADVQERLNSYFKFLIVRDPFERLISAYKDKFVHNPRFEPWYKHNIAPVIIRKYRKYLAESRGGLQFQDFVRYLGDPNHKFLDLQFGDHIIHWVTYVELCAPCEINYSVIGHHETLEEDAPYILREAGIDRLVSYPAIPPGITKYNQSKVEYYFSKVSKRDIKRLYDRFEGDFKLFGYKEPTFLFH
ncbi:carbohydrate sulfotransferase 10 [Phyllobates terribilis]|uniref:carbohydrate sulfotransferase 10 n=1 Tax=Phyllobates terribilis TaxID=111132 RepID=UPI003CCB5081